MPPRSLLIPMYGVRDRFCRMTTSLTYGKERYHFDLSHSFKGFGADSRRTIEGVYSFESPDMTVFMSARFHHLQMKWSLHVLKNFWCRRIIRRTKLSEDYPIPPEVRFAMSWVIGRDLMTCTDREAIDILSRAFLLDEIDGRFLGYQCGAPFCIDDFVKDTYFGIPLMRSKPSEEENLFESDDLLQEKGRASFRRVHFR